MKKLFLITAWGMFLRPNLTWTARRDDAGVFSLALASELASTFRPTLMGKPVAFIGVL